MGWLPTVRFIPMTGIYTHLPQGRQPRGRYMGMVSTDSVCRAFLPVYICLEGIKRTAGSHPSKQMYTDKNGVRYHLAWH